ARWREMLPGLGAGEGRTATPAPWPLLGMPRLYHSEVIGLDLVARRVICRDRPPVPYDVLSINIGSTPSARHIPGVAEHAIPVKPIDGFLERFETARARILKRKGRAKVGVIGGGWRAAPILLGQAPPQTLASSA